MRIFQRGRHGTARSAGIVVGLSLLGFAANAPAEPAQPKPSAPTAPARAGQPSTNTAAPTPPDAQALKLREQELEALRAAQRKALASETELRREIEAVGADRRKLNAQLIETAARIRAIENRISAAEARVRPLDDSERAMLKSLDERRAVIAEVLAALQRIGRRPPPAIIVRPEDALASVRTAIMLGAVLPEMRYQAEVVANDLAELARIRKEIAEERASLAKDLSAIARDQLRLALLVQQRQAQQKQVEKALSAARERAVALARQADNLNELIAKLEQSVGRQTPIQPPAPAAPTGDAKSSLAALKDPGRMSPAIAFVSAKGKLPLPVNGVRLREFGAPDGYGGNERGLSLSTRAGAQVTAPCDGWVVYSGPFRNYGQLLILNAGGGYHVLLAGMERISVDLGQFVLTGEPVAVMGGGPRAASAIPTGSSQPVLYVEFRKDGTPVDPGPWWAASEGEKVRG